MCVYTLHMRVSARVYECGREGQYAYLPPPGPLALTRLIPTEEGANLGGGDFPHNFPVFVCFLQFLTTKSKNWVRKKVDQMGFEPGKTARKKFQRPQRRFIIIIILRVFFCC